MKSKKWKYSIFLILFVIILSSCKNKTVQMELVNPQQLTDKSLIIWAWDDTFNVKAAKLASQEIQKTNPEISVSVVSMEQHEILDKLNNYLASGMYNELPDIVLIEDYQIQKLLLQYEQEFADLTDFFDFDIFMDYKTSVTSKDGRHYGIPFDSGTAVMFYREDIIRQAGYSNRDMEDMTWEEYIEIGQKVKEKTGRYMLTVEANDLGLLRIMQQSAGEWYVKQDGMTVNIQDNRALHDAVEIYQQLLKQDIAKNITGWDDFVHAFQKDEVATVVSGCWSISNIKEASDQKGKWRVAAIPRMGSNPSSINASNIGGSSWYILKNRPNVDKAVTFMEKTFAHNEEFMNRLIREISVVTAYKNSQNLEAYQQKDPFFANQKIQVFFAETADRIPSVNYGTCTYEIESIFTEALQNILREQDVEATWKNAQMKAQAIVGNH